MDLFAKYDAVHSNVVILLAACALRGVVRH